MIIFVLGKGTVLNENLVAEQRMPFKCSHTLLYRASAVLGGGFCLIHRAASAGLF